ncbi:hypothetical protein MH117_11275 [Paenibacillus sp. ACRRX]|uniref:hypothetical protein n=1 Tax=Paenibacillus sp. ACRRX TaxID=2918206 RepID=UPI001EF62458|nr:hypothetical protein [Paenibacillus sp. ACRRX]MCG7408002.1 hypothetical protein [Paenibacillus sp. ACRRX]
MRKLNKKIILVATIISCLSVIIILGSNLSSLKAEPGDSQDPLVTKSYVDEQIAKLNGGNGTGTGSNPDNGSSSSNELKIVTIKPGQQLIAKAGAEFVIRAGKAEIFSSDASGVSDLTDGKDLTKGMDAPSNHLLMFPRDGRGIVAKDTPKNSVVVTVRGGYEVQTVKE